MGSKGSEMQTSKLLELPPEVLFQILDHPQLEDLLSLSRTCSFFRKVCHLPLKYRKIDLSAHNDGEMKCEGALNGWWNDDWPPHFDVKDLAAKQQAFIAELVDAKQSGVGGLVRDLTWTIRSHVERPDQTVDLDERMWDVFQKMRFVTKLDLGCFHESWTWKYLYEPPTMLFPCVTDLRLCGIMYPQVVTAILDSIDPACLTNLSLDNLQDPGWSDDRPPYRKSWNAYPFQDVQDSEEPRVRVPGPMRCVLEKLAGRCVQLATFNLRKPGWIAHQSWLNLDYEKAYYVELANFVRATSCSLRQLTLEHGISFVSMPSYQAGHIHLRSRAPVQKCMFMDKCLRDFIWPALMEAQWPVLRKMDITAGRWGDYPGITRPAVKYLRRHLGEEVELNLNDITEHACTLFKGR